MFDYPAQAAVMRPIPKNKIYGYAKAGSALRAQFVTQIQEIVWKYKLAPETVNIPAQGPVQEIQIFEVALKRPEIEEGVLRALDKAIPSLLFFELRFEERVRFAAAYKRRSESDARKNVITVYFETPWQAWAALRPALPLALDLGGLYEQMMQAHMKASPIGLAPRPGEGLPEMAERARLIQVKAREFRQWESKLRTEPQFNRKVDCNQALRRLRAELAELQGGLAEDGTSGMEPWKS